MRRALFICALLSTLCPAAVSIAGDRGRNNETMRELGKLRRELWEIRREEERELRRAEEQERREQQERWQRWDAEGDRRRLKEKYQ